MLIILFNYLILIILFNIYILFFTIFLYLIILINNLIKMDNKKMDFISNLNSNHNDLNNPSSDDLVKVRSLFVKNENKLVYYQEDTLIRELIFLVLRNQSGKTNNNTLFLLVGLHKVSKKHLYMEKNSITHSLLQQNEEPNKVNKCNMVLSEINNKLPKDISEQIKPETKSNFSQVKFT